MGMAIDAAAEVISDLDLPREDIEAAVRQVYRKTCNPLTVVINGRTLAEHEEGCDIFQPGVLNDPRTGDIFKSRAEVI